MFLNMISTHIAKYKWDPWIKHATHKLVGKAATKSFSKIRKSTPLIVSSK